MKSLSKIKIQNLFLFAAILCLGYVASLFLTYSFIVMPGLSIIDDRSFVAAFQGLESRFAFESSGYANIPAMIAFPGSIIFTFLALITNFGSVSLRYVLPAFVLFILGLVSTFYVNLPSNEFIYNAGNPDQIDVSAVRLQFNEVAWTTWNHFRCVTTSLAVALLIRGRQVNSCSIN